MNVAEKLVECLVAEGVQVVFGIPGEENLEVIEALAQSPIRFVTVRHEQGAAFMADVYGRLTGKAGVFLAILGPGRTSLSVAQSNVTGAPEEHPERSFSPNAPADSRRCSQRHGARRHSFKRCWRT